MSYDEVAPVTTQVRIHSNHMSPVSPPGVIITNSEDVADSVFSMDELTESGLLTGECTGTGIVSIRGTKGERPLSSHFPLDMPGLNKQFHIPNSTPTSNITEIPLNNTLENRQLILKRIKHANEGENVEKCSIKCEDYGFQMFNTGSGNRFKLQIEPTKEYCTRIGDYHNFENNDLLLPGDQLVSINGIQIKTDQTEKRKRERHGARVDFRDQVTHIIRGSEAKDTCKIQVQSLSELVYSLQSNLRKMNE